MVNEDMKKIFHLMGYKSEETLGNLKGSERLNENKQFSDIWSKTKTILTESEDMMGEELHGNQDEIDANHDGKITDADFELPRKEGNMYEMDGNQPQRVNQAGIKATALDSVKRDVPGMSTIEKGEYNEIITKISDFFAKNGNQYAGQTKTLLDRLMKAIDAENQKSQSSQMPVGEGSHMYEEKDRFSEVFDLGEEEMGEY
jgi:hypothetical protein